MKDRIEETIMQKTLLALVLLALLCTTATAQRKLNWVDVVRSGTANTFAGWNSSGDPAALTATQATAALNTFTSGLQGLVPASGGGTANFLRADGSWAIAPGVTDLSFTAGTRTLNSSTGADVVLPLFTSTEAGLVPLSGGGTANFLRADGSWAAPGSIGGSTGGTDNAVLVADGAGGSTLQASSTIVDANGRMTVTQSSPTGNFSDGVEVLRLISSSSGDDPTVKYFQASVNTTNASGYGFPVPTTDGRVYQLKARVVARRTGGAAGTTGDGAGYVLVATFSNTGGVLSQIGTTTVVAQHESQAGWNATLAVGGTDAQLNIFGAADNDITWHVMVEVMDVGS